MGIHTIGIAEMKIAKAPDKIVTLGLGSCIGLVLYDPITKISGMAHIMLPDSGISSNNGNKVKFADTAVSELVNQLTKAGAVRHKLRAKVAGGAHMFKSVYKNDVLNIGDRNTNMCRKALEAHQIGIESEDVGGQSGRSIEFNCESAQLQIRTVSPKSMRLI